MDLIRTGSTAWRTILWFGLIKNVSENKENSVELDTKQANGDWTKKREEVERKERVKKESKNEDQSNEEISKKMK